MLRFTRPAQIASLILVVAITSAAFGVAVGGRPTGGSADPVATIEGRAAASRASISLKPGSITGSDLARRSVQAKHLSLTTMRTVIGAGPVRQRPRATSATVGYLFFAEDVDGGALFRSNGRRWEQLTTGRLGRIARNSIDSSRIKPGGVEASRLADGAVTARAMSAEAWSTISTSGSLAARPEARTRPAGSFWFATDERALYQSDGAVWALVSSLGGAADLAPGSITSALIADGAVTASDLAVGAVTGSNIAANAITATHIAADAVTSSEVADGSLTLADISQSVWDDRLASGTLASRPAASSSNASSLYFATDEAGGTLSRSDGTTWSVAAHARQPRMANFLFGVWTNMPATLSEVYGTNRNRVPMDLSTATQVRLSTNVLTVGTGSLCLHYSLDNGSSWNNFDSSAGTGCVGGVAQVPVTALGLQVSAWVDVPTVARNENAIIRIVSIGGNGVLDPNFGVTTMEIR